MSNLFTERVLNMAAVTPQPEDYTGEDGLLYCGKCHTPKEAYFPEKQAALFGRDRHPAECDCQKAQRLEREAAEQRRKHLDTVEGLETPGIYQSYHAGMDFRQRQREMPANGDCTLLCGALGNHARGKYRLSAMGQGRHRKKLFCRVYR